MTAHLPLELIVLLGSFTEEIISPLPSFIVLVPVGAAAFTQQHAVWYLIVLAICSGLGRLPAALILYWAANRFESTILHHRRFFGISHKEVERFGKRLGASRKRDTLLLFLMNALPVFPTMMLSLACGFLQVPKRMFIVATFFGAIVNACCYLLVGYAGVRVAETLSRLELAGQIVGGLLLVAAVVWLLRQQRRRGRQR